ncbi:hypothetical protein [Haliovirga abyssi]|uniref:KAP NTPase domain-containing protein n=1 Tax=Haliovirga abyssi TaxID=2996794 RepID=A0AAU9DZ13_9FUSO|nr:hypothetical protein [Haliovirga abyssi]BDU50720.1 hypothetical protein HLVA_12890 [Haliovirga abyssi]
MADESVIKINLGEEYKAKVEKINEFEKSVFNEVYLKAFKNTAEILKSKGIELHENYNNIIAFAGERGTGKTSAMLSFAGVLKDNDKLKNNKDYNLSVEDKKLSSYNFCSVGVIDPALLSGNSNILEIIIAKMFQTFKNDIETKNEVKNENLKREIIGSFEKVYENIKIIKDKRDVFEEEALDALLKIAESTSLKSDVEKLIGSYLEFMNNDEKKEKNGILVIEVDDIDLNTEYAYEMVEQIRKYLIIPKVVILMAIKIEQLEQIVERNYLKEFESLLDKKAMSYDEIKNMTEKYLEKLIPLERRLYLPKLEDIRMTSKVEVNYENGNKIEGGIIDQFVRKQIYLKTDMIFIDGKYIIPDNLRGLVELIVLLVKMEDVRDLKKRKKERIEIINSENFIKFKEYIFENWIKTYLTYQQQNALKELVKRDVTERNKFIINKIEDIYSLLDKDDEYRARARARGKGDYEQEIEYQNIVNLNNNGANVSLGDLLFVLNKADRYKIELQDKKFIYAIKMIYSIMLYELYAKAVKEAKEAKFTKVIKVAEVEKAAAKKTYSDYQKLLGGYLYNPIEYKIMRKEQDSNEKRDRRDMKVDKIKSFSEEYKKNGSKLDAEELLNKFNIKSSEFNFIKNNIYRKEKEVYYNKKDNSKPTKIQFDILGFLFNREPTSDSDFYIGNIEILERILNEDYKAVNKSYFVHFKTFFKNFKELEINFNLGADEKLELKDDAQICDIYNFIIDIEKKELEGKFNDIFKVEVDIDKLIGELITEIDGLKITNRITNINTIRNSFSNIKNIIENNKKISEDYKKEIIDFIEGKETEAEEMKTEKGKIRIKDFVEKIKEKINSTKGIE